MMNTETSRNRDQVDGYEGGKMRQNARSEHVYIASPQ